MILPCGADAREVYSLNDGWIFRRGDSEVSEAVHLPHCWNADAYATRDYYRGKGFYSRRIAVDSLLQGQRFFLKFDGAASASQLSSGSDTIGSRIGAYSPHIYDITDCASGAARDYCLSVDNSRGDIPPYSADFTFMGGAYRDAWLVVCGPTYFDFTENPDCGFKLTSLREPGGEWSVGLTGTIVNTLSRRRSLTLAARIIAPDGSEFARAERKLRVKPGSECDFRLDFGKLPAPELWTPDSPILYNVELSMTADGELLDSGRSATAFRTFAFDEQGRFLLNGKPLKLRGMCRHQDMAPFGIALTDEMHRRDLHMIKDMGANFIRISHYPQDDAVLEMCDRLGLIAWEEIPVIDFVPDTPGFDDNCETMLRDMIRRHYNHPSVAMWGYMNEILLRVPAEGRDSTYRRTRRLAERLERVVAEEDPHRMSTMAFHGSDVYHSANLSDITDVQGWNLYQGWYGGELHQFGEFLSRQHAEHPAHKLIVSEYSAGSDRRLHSLRPVPFDFSIEYQQKYLEHYLPVIEDSAFVAGASHWNFIDFSSANRAESMPHINNKGLVSNDRRPKDVYHYYRAAWHDLPDTVGHIAVADWPERTDLPDSPGRVRRPVKVYTNLPEVEMLLNGISAGKMKVAKHSAVFDLEFKGGKNMIELLATDGTLVDLKTVNYNIFDLKDGRLALGTAEFAVNLGSDCYFTSAGSGLEWLPDCEWTPGAVYGHVGGQATVTQDEIALTGDDPLLQRALKDLREYIVAVEDGEYELELLFVEHSRPSAASAYMLGHNSGSGSDLTRMDIILNGKLIEQNFAPSEVAGEKSMVRRRYAAKAAGGGGLRLQFIPRGGITSLAGLKIRRK